MSDLASSAVTAIRTWPAGGLSGKDQVHGYYDVALTGQGDTTDEILATAFGLTKIEHCGNAIVDDNSAIYPAVPNYDGSAILLANLAQATDADRTDPATATGITVRIFVAGYR
jgi:hypothetical protein